jgi:aspartate/methionine/tyrosine aminotransferase
MAPPILLSQRTAFERRLNALALALDKCRAAGRAFVDLTGSNPTSADLPYPREAILAALADERALRYRPESFGLPDARELLAMSGRLAHAPSADRIVLTASTSEAYALVFKLLCDPGDTVAIPEPSYPLFEHLARLEGVRLVPYRLAYDGAWHVDFVSLEQAAAAGARAIVVVSPNNPTGSFLKKDEHARIAALGLPIVSDDVFA